MSFLAEKWAAALTYNDYVSQAQALFERGLTSPSDTEGQEKMLAYTKLNFSRMARWDKQYQPSAALLERLSAIDTKQYWLVISEVWCGDAAQNLPFLAKIAAALPEKIELRVIWRDSHLDLMDQYLTNGGRSIPKLIIWEEGASAALLTWGPRPAEAQALVMAYKADPQGRSFEQFAEELHAWYAKDKGQSLEAEFMSLFVKA